MNTSHLRTRGEKILFGFAVTFSALIWLTIIVGIVSSLAGAVIERAKSNKTHDIAASASAEIPEPCIYLYQDFYYFVTQEEAAKYPDQITCLSREQIPPNIYDDAVSKFRTAFGKESPLKQTVKPAAAAFALFSAILIYALLIFFFIYVITALAMAIIRLNGVKISKTQYPAFYKIYEETALALGLKKIPDAYIIQTGGDINAFAIKITRKKMIVFYAELIETLVEGHKMDELRAVAAHELTHVLLKHINYWFFLAPFRILPFLSALLSRMRETSADRGALMITEDHEVVSQALVKLVTGKFVAQHVNIDEYVKQPETEKGLFIMLAKLIATHPPIPKRIAYLRKIAGKLGA